jgi:hypothetical protein
VSAARPSISAPLIAFGKMDADAKEIWNRLRKGRSLDGLGLPMKEGRLDPSEFSAPQPRTEWYSDSRFSFGLLRGMLDLRRITWRNLDFRGADLCHLRFDRCLVDDCIFDECDCRDWRLWGSRISRCSFRGADLRESALGNTTRGWNIWEDVDFSGADLRDTTYTAGEFARCQFGDAKLTKVDFGGMSFRDCVFEGPLDEVLFDAEPPGPPRPFPPQRNAGGRHAPRAVLLRGIPGPRS